MPSRIKENEWPQVWIPNPPEGGNAPGIDITKLGLVDIGCVGTVAYNNLHCLLCPEREECETAAAESQEVYKPDHYRTRSDITEQLERKPRGLEA